MIDFNTQYPSRRIAIDPCLREPAKELTAGCDPDFDNCDEQLEREFHDLCSLLVTFE